MKYSFQEVSDQLFDLVTTEEGLIDIGKYDIELLITIIRAAYVGGQLSIEDKQNGRNKEV